MSKENPTKEELIAAEERYNKETAKLEAEERTRLEYHSKGSWCNTLHDLRKQGKVV